MIASAIVGGVLGTLVFSTLVKAASQMAWTRMDLPLLLGTAATDNRLTARASGYLFHLGIGVLFAIAYGEVFTVVGRSTWWLGAMLGALHASPAVKAAMPPRGPVSRRGSCRTLRTRLSHHQRK